MKERKKERKKSVASFKPYSKQVPFKQPPPFKLLEYSLRFSHKLAYEDLISVDSDHFNSIGIIQLWVYTAYSIFQSI